MSGYIDMGADDAAWASLPEEQLITGPCGACGRNPATGFASAWTRQLGETWLCHGDDDESPTCYEATLMTAEEITSMLARGIDKPLDPNVFMGDGTT